MCAGFDISIDMTVFGKMHKLRKSVPQCLRAPRLRPFVPLIRLVR